MVEELSLEAACSPPERNALMSLRHELSGWVISSAVWLRRKFTFASFACRVGIYWGRGVKLGPSEKFGAGGESDQK